MARKIFVLISFLIFSVTFSQNTIKPYNLDNVNWEIFSCSWNSGPPPTVYYFNHYQLCGDTIYQGQKYKRIFEGTASQYPSFPGGPVTLPHPQPSVYNFYGFFRQDSILKRNYLRLPSWSNDTLLMDYNLQVGDTIKSGLYYQALSWGPCGTVPVLQIISTDTIIIGNNKFKIFYTDSASYQLYNQINTVGYFFIEGLGHINGIFEYGIAQESYCHPFENCPGVDTIIFNSPCINIAGIKEQNNFFDQAVYPVPANNILKLNVTASGKIKIYNSLGETVLQFESKNRIEEIDISKLAPGIYFLEMEADRKMYTTKFVKE